MVEQLPPPHTVEVAEDVFAYIQPDGSWWLNNTGFIVGDDNVVAIDATSTERRTRALLDAIRVVTTTPVRTLVNTHHHGDHTNGNCLFSDATVIGHRLCRDGVLAQVIGGNEAVFGDVEWGELTIRPPEVVFDDHLTLYVGDVRVELHHLGTAAHTTNDVVAWLPDKRVLFTGDLVFNGGTPFMLMGSVAGFLDAMPRLREFGAATLVPGHGPVCEPAAIDDGEHYAQFVLELAVEASDAGLAPLDAARQADLGEFSDLYDRERIVGNLHRAMAELDGLERGAAIDVPAAFGDMLAFHGGKLRCLA